MSGWIGVDLDGTLARYDGWKGEAHIGEPIPLMAQRVKAWLLQGIEVRIFTARVWQPSVQIEGRKSVEEIVAIIQDWTEKHFGQRLMVTNIKDFGMIELWDDRAVGIELNTGEYRNGPCR